MKFMDLLKKKNLMNYLHINLILLILHLKSSDHYVRSYYKTYKLPIIITNCSNNYGPYQHKEKFIPTIIKSLLDRKNTSIW